jgi:hypothetical protein
LLLTGHERQAFDWAGSRYNSDKVSDPLSDCLPEDRAWADDGDVTFVISEPIAWQINELAEQGGYSWACFAPDLAEKLNKLCWGIV